MQSDSLNISGKYRGAEWRISYNILTCSLSLKYDKRAYSTFSAYKVALLLRTGKGFYAYFGGVLPRRDLSIE
jgi:hypothetical protein